MKIYWILSSLLFLAACGTSNSQPAASNQSASSYYEGEPVPDYSQFETPSLKEAGLMEVLSGKELAIFAGGCFWCMEEVFQRVNGVQGVYSGYIGGTEPHLQVTIR
ncbi:MAG: peptide-methionine (S)-S-oxide reductase [Saprospiraceae bacterium]